MTYKAWLAQNTPVRSQSFIAIAQPVSRNVAKKDKRAIMREHSHGTKPFAKPAYSFRAVGLRDNVKQYT
jgi:hypothetical protein